MATATWCSFLGLAPFSTARDQLGAPSPVGPRSDARTLFGGMWASEFPDWRHRRTGLRPDDPAPDLATTLASQLASGPACDDLALVESVIRPLASSVFVGRCFADDEGHFGVAVYPRTRVAVRVAVGDTFFAGVQVSGHAPSGTFLAEPHLLRRLCINGACAEVHDVAARYVRWSDTDTEGDLASVVQQALSGSVLLAASSDLARAMRTPRPDPQALRGRRLLHVTDAVAVAITAAARQEAPTLYGLYNAITRVARDLPDLRLAMSLERQAGRLVATLLHQPDDDPVATQPLAPV